MPISYYAARANLYYLWRQHPDWSHAELAAAVGCSTSWVAKWLKRFGEELAAGQRLEQVLQGHSRARKTPPTPTHSLVVEQILAIRDQPRTLEQARTVTAAFVQHYNVERPNQALTCGNRPPLIAFAHLPALPPLPTTVDPDAWLAELDGVHLERKVDRHGMVSVDLKR